MKSSSQGHDGPVVGNTITMLCCQRLFEKVRVLVGPEKSVRWYLSACGDYILTSSLVKILVLAHNYLLL